MGDTTIEWTDKTWNPIRGCTRVSEGCRNCYAEGVAYRFSGEGQAYEGLVRIGADGQRRREWSGQIKFVEEHLLDPLRWRKPARIFVNSMSDLFHENVTDEMRDKIFAVMALCPQHTFQVLTKRPERMLAYCTYGYGRIADRVVAMRRERGDKSCVGPLPHLAPGSKWWPLANVWLGVSVENQKAADERIPLLLQTPAWHHFISAEPLLGSVSLRPEWFDVGEIEVKMDGDLYDSLGEAGRAEYVRRLQVEATQAGFNQLDWVIVGGESGPGARPMHPEWARSLRDQCQDAGVPFFFKQWGEWAPGAQQADYRKADQAAFERLDLAGRSVRHDGCLHCATDGLFYRVGKKAAGHLLDGQEWHQFPQI